MEIISQIALGLTPEQSSVLPEYVCSLPCQECCIYSMLVHSDLTLMAPACVGSTHRLFCSVMEEMNRRVFEPYRQFFPSALAHNKARWVVPLCAVE